MIEDVDCFLFSVLVLGHLRDRQGNTWRREIVQMYTVEVTISEQRKTSATCQLLKLLPNAFCLQPNKCFHTLSDHCKCHFHNYYIGVCFMYR